MVHPSPYNPTKFGGVASPWARDLSLFALRAISDRQANMPFDVEFANGKFLRVYPQISPNCIQLMVIYAPLRELTRPGTSFDASNWRKLCRGFVQARFTVHGLVADDHEATLRVPAEIARADRREMPLRQPSFEELDRNLGTKLCEAELTRLEMAKRPHEAVRRMETVQ